MPGVQPVMFPVVGQDGDVTSPQPQRGLAFPRLSEPAGLGQFDVAEVPVEQVHAAAALRGLQLQRVPGHRHLGAMPVGAAR